MSQEEADMLLRSSSSILFLVLLVLAAVGSGLAMVGAASSTGVFASGILTLSFDDERDGQILYAADILRSMGFKATAFVYPTGLTAIGGYMRPDDVSKLADDYGWEIGSETMTHRDLTTCPDTDCLRSEIEDSKTRLAGYGWNITSFAYPFGKGSRNETIRPIVESSYRAARVVDYPMQAPPRYGDVGLDSYKIESNDVLNTTPVSTVEAWIDTAIETKTWLVLRFHQIAAYDARTTATYLTTDLQTVVEYARTRVEAQSLRVMTFAGALDRIGWIKSGKADFLDPVPARNERLPSNDRQPNSTTSPPPDNSTDFGLIEVLRPFFVPMVIAGGAVVLIVGLWAAGIARSRRRRTGRLA